MAEVYLPTFSGVYHWAYRIDLDLDGIDRELEFHFNGRDSFGTGGLGAWYLTIKDVTGTVLVAGVKLALGRNILRKFRYKPGMPKGQLHVVDTQKTAVEPGPDDFGSRVVLAYDREVAT